MAPWGPGGMCGGGRGSPVGQGERLRLDERFVVLVDRNQAAHGRMVQLFRQGVQEGVHGLRRGRERGDMGARGGREIWTTSKGGVDLLTRRDSTKGRGNAAKAAKDYAVA